MNDNVHPIRPGIEVEGDPVLQGVEPAAFTGEHEANIAQLEGDHGEYDARRVASAAPVGETALTTTVDADTVDAEVEEEKDVATRIRESTEKAHEWRKKHGVDVDPVVRPGVHEDIGY